MDKKAILDLLARNLTPALLQQVAAELPDKEATADNQNQNQGALEDFAKLKPEVLRTLAVSVTADEAMDNQNQNQSKLEDLLKLKPTVLRDVRVAFSSGDEAQDNQNQNQGNNPEAATLKPGPAR